MGTGMEIQKEMGLRLTVALVECWCQCAGRCSTQSLPGLRPWPMQCPGTPSARHPAALGTAAARALLPCVPTLPSMPHTFPAPPVPDTTTPAPITARSSHVPVVVPTATEDVESGVPTQAARALQQGAVGTHIPVEGAAQVPVAVIQRRLWGGMLSPSNKGTGPSLPTAPPATSPLCRASTARKLGQASTATSKSPGLPRLMFSTAPYTCKAQHHAAQLWQRWAALEQVAELRQVGVGWGRLMVLENGPADVCPGGVREGTGWPTTPMVEGQLWVTHRQGTRQAAAQGGLQALQMGRARQDLHGPAREPTVRGPLSTPSLSPLPLLTLWLRVPVGCGQAVMVVCPKAASGRHGWVTALWTECSWGW